MTRHHSPNFTHLWFYFTEPGRKRSREDRREGGEEPGERARDTSLHESRCGTGAPCARTACTAVPPLCVCVAYISVMVSGRLVGISVSPFPLQSTMLLLQVHDSGHCRTLHAEDEDEW